MLVCGTRRRLFFFFVERLILGQKDTLIQAKTFFLRLFLGQKHSNFSEELYFAFQTLALSVLPPCPKIVPAPLLKHGTRKKCRVLKKVFTLKCDCENFLVATFSAVFLKIQYLSQNNRKFRLQFYNC